MNDTGNNTTGNTKKGESKMDYRYSTKNQKRSGSRLPSQNDQLSSAQDAAFKRGIWMLNQYESFGEHGDVNRDTMAGDMIADVITTIAALGYSVADVDSVTAVALAGINHRRGLLDRT